MSKKVKQIINVVLPTIAFAMGVAVIVLTIVDDNVTAKELIRLLAFAIVSLGLFALNNKPKEK